MAIWNHAKIFVTQIMTMLYQNLCYIYLKPNFTLWTTEYIFTFFDLTKLNIVISCWYPP